MVAPAATKVAMHSTLPAKRPAQDWSKIEDRKLKKRIQNRVAQQTYRARIRQRLEELQRQVDEQKQDQDDPEEERGEDGSSENDAGPIGSKTTSTTTATTIATTTTTNNNNNNIINENNTRETTRATDQQNAAGQPKAAMSTGRSSTSPHVSQVVFEQPEDACLSMYTIDSAAQQCSSAELPPAEPVRSLDYDTSWMQNGFLPACTTDGFVDLRAFVPNLGSQSQSQKLLPNGAQVIWQPPVTTPFIKTAEHPVPMVNGSARKIVYPQPVRDVNPQLLTQRPRPLTRTVSAPYGHLALTQDVNRKTSSKVPSPSPLSYTNSHSITIHNKEKDTETHRLAKRQSTIEHTIERVLGGIKRAGFPHAETAISQLYTADFNSHPVLANKQRLSRKRNLPPLLADLRTASQSWSPWEASAYQSEIVMSAEDILVAEWARRPSHHTKGSATSSNASSTKTSSSHISVSMDEMMDVDLPHVSEPPLVNRRSTPVNRKQPSSGESSPSFQQCLRMRRKFQDECPNLSALLDALVSANTALNPQSHASVASASMLILQFSSSAMSNVNLLSLLATC